MSSLLTSGCMKWLINGIVSESNDTGSWIGWGTGSGQVTASTQLEGLTGSLVMATGSLASGGIAAQWIGTQTATFIMTASEAGLFTASDSSSATMVLYGDYTPIPLEVNDKIEYTFVLKMV